MPTMKTAVERSYLRAWKQKGKIPIIIGQSKRRTCQTLWWNAHGCDITATSRIRNRFPSDCFAALVFRHYGILSPGLLGWIQSARSFAMPFAISSCFRLCWAISFIVNQRDMHKQRLIPRCFVMMAKMKTKIDFMCFTADVESLRYGVRARQGLQRRSRPEE